MSTDTSHNLPDTGMLERLANELFTALPGSPVQGISPQQIASSLDAGSLFNKRDGFNVKDPQTSLPDPHFAGAGQTPPSFGAFGGSSSAIPSVQEVQGSNLPDPFNSGFGHVPPSLGGSGISPSALDKQPGAYDPKLNPVTGSAFSPAAIEQHNGIHAKTPQTSLADPNYNGSKQIPALGHNDVFDPYALQGFSSTSEHSFEPDLRNVLASIHTYQQTPQLPGFPSAAPDQSYYFLSGKESLHGKGDASQFNQQHLTQQKAQQGALISAPFDVNLIKKDFPILQERVNGRPLIWLDNAATTQKPKQVIDRISYFYEHENSNIHRAAHELAARATDAYEAARQKVQTFINAGSINEIVFVRGATEAINLVAKSWGEQHLNAGDEIIVSHLEHHANIVPWQQLAAKKGLKLRVIPVDDDGQILLEEYAKLLGPKTKLVSFTQVSNALGTVTPAKRMVEMAHQAGAKVLVDGAQSVSHMRVDVRDLNCDWFVFSGHKVFGPTGIGVVYGKEELLNATQPWQGGGNMIVDVTFEHTTYHQAPGRFEAGTGNIADAVGLGAAIDYVSRIGMDVINQYEHYLLVYATRLLKDIPGLTLIGTASEKASVLSFVFDGYRTEEVGAALNHQGIAVRSGHHCAQPILRRFGHEATVRPSLAFYNTCADIDVLVDTLYRLRSGHKQSVR
ncbi:MAG: cysteine desulfurase [Cytophagales bacterium]|nr:cysteine desulfurase [Cytophaga sp.]